MPAEGNADIFQDFNEAVNDGVTATEEGDFMDKNLFDLPGPRQFLDPIQPVPLILNRPP